MFYSKVLCIRYACSIPHAITVAHGTICALRAWITGNVCVVDVSIPSEEMSCSLDLEIACDFWHSISEFF